MEYIIEFIDIALGTGRHVRDTIKSDSPIPVPDIGEVIDTPGGLYGKVVERRYWYMNVDNSPKVKIQIQCEEIQ